MTAPRILALRCVPLDDGYAAGYAARPGFCRLCDRQPYGGAPELRGGLCRRCVATLRQWREEAEAASPLGVGLSRMEGAWPLGELDEVASEWRGGGE
jgi:hypothetical protein